MSRRTLRRPSLRPVFFTIIDLCTSQCFSAAVFSYILISMSTPAGKFRFVSDSIVFGVGS